MGSKEIGFKNWRLQRFNKDIYEQIEQTKQSNKKTSKSKCNVQ